MNKPYRKINANDLHYLEASSMHPANTYFHFSFANYYNPNNMNFGVLRVLNDDEVKPQSGFGTHPHENIEVISYVVDGKLTHRDSAGFHDTLERGHVQTISAGTGVTHSELNEQSDWCRFLQIWIRPETEDLPVRYENYKYQPEDRENKLLKIVDSSKDKDHAHLYACQDVNLYVSELTGKNNSVNLNIKKGRQAYLNCFEGSINIKNLPSLNERDSLEVYGKTDLEISSESDNAHFILIEMKAD